MKVYEFDDYKHFLNTWIKARPKNGHGVLRKMAAHLSVHTTMLSHTIRGSKDLSLEQAYAVTEFLGLGKLETDYFLLLVQIARAGTKSLKIKLKQDLADLKSETQDLKKRVTTDTDLSEESKAIFYSSWVYSAFRQLSSIKDFQNRDSLLDAFSINEPTWKN